MLRMQARPALRVRRGPLLFPARYLLLVSGLIALALSVFILFRDLHAKQVDNVYTAISLAVGVVWLASIILGFRGQKVGVFLTGAIGLRRDYAQACKPRLRVGVPERPCVRWIDS